MSKKAKLSIEAIKRLHARAEQLATSEDDPLFQTAGRMIKELGPDAADLADDHRIIENRLRAKRINAARYGNQEESNHGA